MLQAPSLRREVKIKVRNLEMVYRGRSPRRGDVAALQQVNFDVYENEIATIIGPSGCGKTTLLFLIAGLLEPTDGEILVDGERVAGSSSQRAVIFQQDAVFPWLTVFGNIEYGLKLKGTPFSERKKIVSHYIDLVGLSEFEDAYPKELSGGMRKRVDIARCYAINPAILLMDEPFGSLDVFTKERMQKELLRIWRTERKTICFVTHDIEEALFISQRVIILSARPGIVRRVIQVPFSENRDLSLRTTNKFQELRRELWQEIARGEDAHERVENAS